MPPLGQTRRDQESDDGDRTQVEFAITHRLRHAADRAVPPGDSASTTTTG